MLEGRELSDSRLQMDSLDGLRGLAMLLVFLSHTSNAGMFLLPPLNFAGNGRAGVYLFFVLSAFLLTYPFIRQGKGTLSVHFLLNYCVRRVFRIYPLYFACLLTGFLSTFVLWRVFDSAKPWGLPFTLSFTEFVDHLLLRQGQGVTWSIVVEFHFYMVLPPLALVYAVLLRNNPLLCTLLTAILMLAGQLLWPQAETLADDIRLGPYLPLFLMGSLLAVLHHRWQKSPLRPLTATGVLIELAGVATFLATCFMIPAATVQLLGRNITLDQFHREFIVYGVLWSVVLFAALNGSGFLRRIFELPFMRYLGFISFSMYLLHMTVITVMQKVFIANATLAGWLALAATIAISHVSWLLIEKPTSRIKLRRRKQETAMEGALLRKH